MFDFEQYLKQLIETGGMEHCINEMCKTYHSNIDKVTYQSPYQFLHQMYESKYAKEEKAKYVENLTELSGSELLKNICKEAMEVGESTEAVNKVAAEAKEYQSFPRKLNYCIAGFVYTSKLSKEIKKVYLTALRERLLKFRHVVPEPELGLSVSSDTYCEVGELIFDEELSKEKRKGRKGAVKKRMYNPRCINEVSSPEFTFPNSDDFNVNKNFIINMLSKLPEDSSHKADTLIKLNPTYTKDSQPSVELLYSLAGAILRNMSFQCYPKRPYVESLNYIVGMLVDNFYIWVDYMKPSTNNGKVWCDFEEPVSDMLLGMYVLQPSPDTLEVYKDLSLSDISFILRIGDKKDILQNCRFVDKEDTGYAFAGYYYTILLSDVYHWTAFYWMCIDIIKRYDKDVEKLNSYEELRSEIDYNEPRTDYGSIDFVKVGKTYFL